MIRNVRARLYVGLAFLAALTIVFVGVVQPRLRVETDLLDLLPRHIADQRVENAIDRFSARLARKVLFLVGASEPQRAHAAAEAFAPALTQNGAFVPAGAPTGGELKAIGQLYLDHRGQLLSQRQEELLATGPDELYREALHALYTPAGLLRPIDPARDPLGLGADYVLEQLPALGNARLEGSQLVVTSADMTWVLVPVETAGSPFAVDVQDQAEQIGRAHV